MAAERDSRERRPAVISMAPEAGRLPPQAPDLERAVLGALMIERAPISQVSDLLRPEHFYVEAHQKIYQAILDLYAKDQPVDILTVFQLLKERGEADLVGGPAYISRLTNGVASAAHVGHHAHIVLQKYILRQIIARNQESTRLAYEDEDCFEVLDGVNQTVADLYGLTQPREPLTAASSLTELTDGTPTRGRDTGTYELDNYLQHHPGKMMIVAGRPGAGKSIIGCAFEWHLSQYGHVLAFTPEMETHEKTARYLSLLSGVNYSDIISKRCTPEEVDRVAKAGVEHGKRLSRILIDPTEGITPTAMRARLDRARKDHDVVAVTVDYLQLMTTGDKRIDHNDYARVTQCSREVTYLAKKSGLPFAVMCQLNRKLEETTEKRPRLSHLRNTGAIEQDAYQVLLLHREGYYQPQPPDIDELEIIVAKNRNGRTGSVKVPIQVAKNRIAHLVVGELPAPQMEPPADDRRTGEKEEKPDETPF